MADVIPFYHIRLIYAITKRRIQGGYSHFPPGEPHGKGLYIGFIGWVSSFYPYFMIPYIIESGKIRTLFQLSGFCPWTNVRQVSQRGEPSVEVPRLMRP
jgi:hypothetical protein